MRTQVSHGDVFVTDEPAVWEARLREVLAELFNQATREKGIRAVTTTYTFADEDDVVTADATGGAFTVTLPTAGNRQGCTVTIIKTDASVNVVTVDGSGAETINGSATQSLTNQYDSYLLLSDGTEWFIL